MPFLATAMTNNAETLATAVPHGVVEDTDVTIDEAVKIVALDSMCGDWWEP